jgi:integrase
VLDKQILPAWAGREFTSIRRGDVAKLLDHIEDNHGSAAADSALAHLSRIFNWYVARREDYVSPIVKGMRRTNPRERARSRILSDDEIRTVWKAAEANGTYGALVRFLLLTAQRRGKVATIRWGDISEDGVWTIPAEDREKGNAVELALPDSALAIIQAQPRFASNPRRGAS